MNEGEQEPAGGAAVFRLTPDSAIWRQVGDEVVVYGVERSEYLATNPAGTLLWPMLAQGATLGELTGVLAERWGLSVGQARVDVETFLAALRAQGLLEA